MAGDHQEPSRRKHRRSSSDELDDESSKRRKHRHHRHHRSKKVEKIESKSDEIEFDGGETALPPPPFSPPRAGFVSVANYDDMEEGEIVEEDGGGGGVVDVELDKKKADSDVESGEIGDGEIRQNRDTVVCGASIEPNCDSSLPSDGNLEQVVGKALLTSVEDCGFDGLATTVTVDRDKNHSDGVKIADGVDSRRSSIKEHHDNGHGGRRDTHKEDNSQHLKTSSPESKGKRKSYYDDENGLRGESKSLSSENTGKKHKNLRYSPSRERVHEEVHTMERSRSRDRTRARSRSQSISRGASQVEKHQKDLTSYADRKYRQDADDERIRKLNQDYRHGSRDLPRDKERGRSSSRSRYIGQDDWHHSLETRERDREGSRETWNRDRGDRSIDRDRKMAEGERERKRERERERDRYREKERDRVGERDRERRRDRDSDRDRNRSTRDDRASRHHHDGYADHERLDDYRRRVSDTYHRDKSSRDDPEKIHSSRNGHSEIEREKLKREEVEEEDYQERIVLQLADQEEDDLNKIKEESRRRRLAILEKYKARPQVEPHVEDKGKENIENPSGPVAAAVVSNSFHGRSEGAEIFLGDTSFSVGKSPSQNGIPDVVKNSGTAGALGEGTPKSERSNDMFRDDIFGESPAGVRKSGKGDNVAIERSGLHDNWDDAEGYYSYRFGEILDGRYEIIAAHGKGVFSTVVRAKDLKAGSGDPEEVAIKIIRNNDTMYKAGLDELIILKKLVGADKEDKRHCVRFLSSFKYRNHLCLVFESLHMNLREVLKKFGRNIGLKLTAVRAYAMQLFIALKHLKNCGVLHCDIKPDNMLVNDAKNNLKLCDFGNAMFAGKNELTPYLVSRFYRAPEIILGLAYDHPMDIWSVGCCLFELYSGKVLFPGATNNDMLRLHMELKGPFPKKMLRKGFFIDHHFDQDLNFLATEEDPVTKKAIKRLILNIKPKDIGSIILGSPGEDPKMLANFKDLLEKIFVLDPDKRITVQQALGHPFITGK